MKDLTKKQFNIYQFISKWHQENGYPPTQAEIKTYFGYKSQNTVRNHLVLIEKKGYIRLNFGRARGIQLVNPLIDRQKNNTIPLLGDIAAGVPLWAEQNFDDQLPINPVLFGGGELFALRVIGDSMTGAGIKSRDIAIIKKQDSVNNGEIAAVLIENEATLKRVLLSSDRLILKPENPAFENLEFPKSKNNIIRILGLYKGIIRTENKLGFS
ncbi:transcriptional repressor LexA [Desulfobacula phenolica]|uniref:LexA repressor n=1 Tax=Desulfobacula phenolica TaxID=90732 RepID=A0A1H2ECB1_9BACT|nr:transcriptional repressor LexA [Desulfobacula phenolica]SDT92772.1 repressor LexA [Desulfobacula phenolica]